MKLSGEVTIHASADRVWAIVGHQFAQIGDWATSIAASRRADDAGPQCGGPAVVGRVCETRVSSFARVTESVIACDDTNRTLTYAARGLPRFVGEAHNRWQASAVGPHQARARFDGVLETRGLVGLIIALPLRVRMLWETRRLLEDLKHYAEQGTPSPSKLRRLGRARPASWAVARRR